MEPRINLMEKAKKALTPVFGIVGYLNKSSIEKPLRELIEYRVSQINGCAYCLDMHSKDLRHGGETEQRIYLMSAWRETDLYTPREKAALGWAEAVTKLEGQEVPAVLLSGDHARIARWRLQQRLGATWRKRPDLLKDLSAEQHRLLEDYIDEYERGKQQDEDEMPQNRNQI